MVMKAQTGSLVEPISSARTGSRSRLLGKRRFCYRHRDQAHRRACQPIPEGGARNRTPREYWLEINRLLVPFDKHICTGTRPRCSVCPVLDMCLQVGVTTQD